MQINFFVDSDLGDYEAGRAEYEAIWNEDGERILATLERVSGFAFHEHTINAIVFDGRGRSHPLSLRHDLPLDRKRSSLVHELGHRLLHGRERKMATSDERHRFLFLILFDVLVELYGEQFARETVAWDSRPELKFCYKNIWDEALAFTAEERRAEFEKLKK
ncbi:MAG: hypothetical protein Q8R39_02680 [bacterium]|nr:hypothetical protein [bacterium]MDZ4284282.1 hypothetical protein [Patescibacteria group bacterium]